MTIDNTHCTGTDVKRKKLIFIVMVVGQGIVEEGLVSFCSSKRDRVLVGLCNLDRTSLLRSGGRRACRQLSAGTFA